MADKKIKKAEEVKSIDQLRVELLAKQKDQLEAKRGHRQGELANPKVLLTLRKDIARLHTAIRVSELSTKEDN